jgi:hypothetical protein
MNGSKGQSVSQLNKAAREYLARKTQREAARLLGRQAGPIVRPRKGHLLRASSQWQRWEIELFPKVSIQEVVRQTGRSFSAVQNKYRRLGFHWPSKTRHWTAEEEKLLGLHADSDVARRIGRSVESVRANACNCASRTLLPKSAIGRRRKNACWAPQWITRLPSA